MARKGREPVTEAPPPAAPSSDELLSSDDDQPEPQPLQPHGDSSSAEEEEEETPPSPPPKSASKKKPVKPIGSKTPAASAPSSKRRGGSDAKDEGTASKKAKGENVEGSHDGGMKPLFQRLWSQADEIGILKGMIDYKVQKRVDPLRDVDSFVKFINKSLHVDVNRSQIMSKIRALKKRFQNAKKKTKIVDPHGLELFDLSKKIWENDLVSVLKKEEEDNEKLQDWVISRRGKEGMKLKDFGDFEFLKDEILKEGWDLLDAGEKAEMRKKWKKQNLEEMKLSLKKMDLIKELIQKTLNAMKSA